MTNHISPNHREVVYAVSSITGDSEYLTSTNHVLDTSGGGGGGGAVTISDGVSSSIKATVFDLTNSNPLATQIVDTTGTAITSFGGGTQYADGAVRGTATGTLSMVDDGTLIQSAKGDSDGTINVNVTKMTGVAPSAGNGSTDSGTQRITISNDSTGQIRLTDGTNILNVNANDAGYNSIAVSNGRKELSSLSAGSLNADLLPSTDVSAYNQLAIQILGTWTGTLTIQGSNDNSNWVSMVWNNTNDTASSATSTATANSIKVANIEAVRFIRVRMTLYTSGTATGVAELTTLPVTRRSFTAAASQNGNWNVGSSSATGSAVPANAFYQGISDGTNLRGILGAANALNSTGTGLVTSQIIGQFDDVSPTSITENQFGNLRMSANRNLYGTIRDAAGNERGANVNASSQLSVSVDNSNISSNIAQMNGVTVSMGSGATGTGVQRVVLANDSGKTLLSSTGSASSSGNNTIVAAGTNKLKVYAFSLTTTSTTAITCKFQSGASGTDLWSVVLQAPTGTSTGANLVVQPPAWLFSTGTATLLNLNLSSANAVQWSVSYIDEA